MRQLMLVAICVFSICQTCFGAPKPELHKKYVDAHRIFYTGGNNETSLPECELFQVCNKIDIYGEPFLKKQCKCVGSIKCSEKIDSSDGHSIEDKSKILKMCEPVIILPKCQHFKDVTRTIFSYSNHRTIEKSNCICPKKSVSYIIKRSPVMSPFYGVGYKYSFACSPKVKLKCRRKEPCRLFTVQKKTRHEEVNTNSLCSCPTTLKCPSHHREPGVLLAKYFKKDGMRTYSGYCM